MVQSRILRRLIRWLIYGRYYLIDRRRLRRPVLEQVAGKSFLVLPEVFNPRFFFSGEFLARHLCPEWIAKGSRVLDLGTGSGVGAVVAAAWAGRVIARDIDSAAVRCARINVCRNQVEDRVEVRTGDLFDDLQDGPFDVILFNPPYFQGRPRTRLERAFRSEDMADRFASSLGDHLAPGGAAYLVLSSSGRESDFLSALRRCGFDSCVVAEESRLLEVFRIHRVERGSQSS